jgi:hypothetical protein
MQLMKKTLLSLCFALITWSICMAGPKITPDFRQTSIQDTTVVLSIDTLIAEKGQLVCLQLSVDNFEEVILLGLQILFNDDVLRFINASVITDLLPGFSENSFSSPENNGSTDKFIISWIDGDLNGEALPPSTEIFEMCFEVIGSDGDKSPLRFENVEIADVNNELLEVEERNGLVCVERSVFSQEEMPSEELQCYPNPTNGSIQFNNPVEKLTIYDETGRKVWELKGLPGRSFDPSALSPGNYWLQTDQTTLPLHIN